MNHKNTVAVQTLGCKLNQAESEDLVHRLSRSGYQVVSASDHFDIFILNGCTVTGIADRKCRNLLRRACKRNPDALFVASGCYSRRSPCDMQSLDSGIVAHQGDSASLVEMLLARRPPATVDTERASCSPTPHRTRSFVKVQEGCEYHCTYCIVPIVRGEVASVDISTVLATIKLKVAEGYREIVLTGTNVGAYDSGNLRLSGLVGLVLEETGAARLRLSSLQPVDVDSDLIAAFKDKRMCRHVHMPLQSGSGTVLPRMGRRYSLGGYRRAVCSLVEGIPELAVSTDVIVGFPGETEAEHIESLDFCRAMAYAAIHVFPYSPRPGTPAARLAPVHGGTKKRRTDEFLELASESRRRFHSRFLCRRMEVLWEEKVKGSADTWSGLTDNYIRVHARSEPGINNAFLPVTLLEDKGGWVKGKFEGYGTAA